MQQKKYFAFAWYVVLIAQASLTTIAWIAGVYEPIKEGMARGIDFPAYYTGSYIVRFIDPRLLYNMPLQQEVQQQVFQTYHVSVERLYPYNHPPVYVGLLYLIGSQDYNATYIRWLVFLVSAHLLTIWVLIKWLQNQGVPKQAQISLAIASLLFYSLHVAYLKGQDSSFLLLGVTLWMYGLMSDKANLTALGLTLAMVRPQIALALLVPTIFHTWRTTFPWLLKWSILFFILNFTWIRTQGIMDFIAMLIHSGSGDNGYGFDIHLMATFMGAVLRAFPTIDARLLHTLGYVLYFLTIALFSWWWLKSSRITPEQAGFLIVLTLLVSPHTHNHDHSLYLLPAIVLAIHWLQTSRLPARFAGFIPLGVSLLLAIEAISKNTFSVYLTALLLGLPLWQIATSRQPAVPSPA